jgi:UDP-N-acetylglucosamine 2-epimerase (non-hydrolysing)
MAPALLHLVAAARPNFMKVAPLWHALRKAPEFDARIVHTGQHYDANMSEAFFADLGLPEPHHNLGVGSGSHAEQTARVMVGYEKLCEQERPAWTIVVGDVNSTAAVAMVCAKLLVPVAHLEAGLRSRDRTMPEEINRLITDVIAELLWTPSPDADDNLRQEGVPETRIERVGNIMIDSFELLRERIAVDRTWQQMGLADRRFGVVTLHRPANVDDRATLETLIAQLAGAAGSVTLVFPVHPRTRKQLVEFGLYESLARVPNLRLTEPLGYQQFMSLVMRSRFVITDSGGVQEETTYLDIPCVTVRPNTERPITLSQGTNRLVAPTELLDNVRRILAGDWPRGRTPDLWDGHTAVRCVESLRRRIAGRRLDTLNV